MSFPCEAFPPKPMMLLLLRTVQPEVQAQARDKKSQSNPQHLAISLPKIICLTISILQKDISVSLNPIIEKGQLPSARAGFPAQMFPPMILNDTEMYLTTVIQCYNSNLPQCTVQVHCYSATLVHCYISALLHCAAPLII